MEMWTWSADTSPAVNVYVERAGAPISLGYILKQLLGANNSLYQEKNLSSDGLAAQCFYLCLRRERKKFNAPTRAFSMREIEFRFQIQMNI